MRERTPSLLPMGGLQVSSIAKSWKEFSDRDIRSRRGGFLVAKGLFIRDLSCF